MKWLNADRSVTNAVVTINNKQHHQETAITGGTPDLDQSNDANRCFLTAL